MTKNKNRSKVLVLDVETSFLEVRSWGIRDQFISDDDIIQDWSILSFAAKWLGDPPTKVIYRDTSKKKNKRDDKEVVKELWKLLDEADVCLTQNGKRFDVKKVQTRFLYHGLPPTSHFQQIDILVTNKKHFSHTSNKLKYVTNKLNKKYKKLSHGEFPGNQLWIECMKGNKKAWAEMKKYNIYDILSLEETYNILAPWDKQVNFNVLNDGEHVCTCGSKKFHKRGYKFTNTGKFQQYRCNDCGKHYTSGENLLKETKKILR